MCGIIGILSSKDVAAALLEGLRRLEYRGYDSAGIATVHAKKIDRRRAEGKLRALEEKLASAPLLGTTGIGHTRWATHGGPTESNAHPHATEKVAVVHNGIIENYADLKAELESYQVRFESQTDTEVIAHLVTHYLNQGLSPKDATFKALDRLQGAFSVALIFAEDPNVIIGARQGTPLAVGHGENEMFLASDSYALAPFTRKITFLEDGDRVVLTQTQVEIFNAQHKKVSRPVRITAQSGATTGKGAYRHFMRKEIDEQPAVIGDTLNTFINPATGAVTIPEGMIAALAATPRLTLSACGTAYYACLVAKYWFETLARLPCDVDVASEFRYRNPPLPEGGVALFVSQSGETLDTLECLRFCKRNGQRIVSVVNGIESTIERESDDVLHTLAGPEIGVASTKAFTTQLTTLACVALAVARARGTLTQDQEKVLSEALRTLPRLCAEILAHDEQLQPIAASIATARDVLYLGRGAMVPLAFEGALKLKEVSYIHAEGYAAGEMKHGPIALIDDQVPVVVLAPSDALFEKTASNIQETIARGGKVFLISDEEGCKRFKGKAVWTLALPRVPDFIAPVLYAIPTQLLAYHAAIAKGTDVDQPRNLAKSVTVE